MNDEWWMMNDEWWMMNDEWWMMNDEWWMINNEGWIMNDEPAGCIIAASSNGVSPWMELDRVYIWCVSLNKLKIYFYYSLLTQFFCTELLIKDGNSGTTVQNL